VRRIVIGALVLPYFAACSADNADRGNEEETSGCGASCGETTSGLPGPGTSPPGNGTSAPVSTGTNGTSPNGTSPNGTGVETPAPATATPSEGPSPTSPGPGATPSSPPTSSSGDDSNPSAPPASDCGVAPKAGHYQMENLDRGLIAVRKGNANYVGWRMLGWEYSEEQARVAYNLYRDGQLVAEVSDSTNYLDEGASADARYSVALLVEGQECEKSEPVSVWGQNYVNIPLEPPPGGTVPGGESYAYNTARETRSSGSVGDGSVGDLDGDGTYEVVVIWEPSNAKDNSQAGYTGPVYIDAYKLTGERLWRMNLGPNIRAGAHYTQFLVYDLDGDGKAEVAFRTAPGVKDGTGAFLSKGPAANDDDSADYRNAEGYVLSGPEYLTVFDGATGAELATVNFETARGTVSSWGDNYGNRVDRFLASVGFVSDMGGSGKGSGRPALLMARGYYTRATVNAYTWRDNELKKIWTADSNNAGSSALAGQGAHYMAVADVDADGAQEIIYGAAMIQSDGSFGCSTGFGHGDAMHVTDLVPSRPGLEVFMPHEDKSKPWWDVRQAEDCKILFKADSDNVDNGRGVAADVSAASPGAEFWSSAESGMRSATTNASVGNKPSQTNFVIWWDADELRETEDGTSIRKANGTEVFSCNQCMSNNHTKATPTLTADLFGDWREEIIWRTPDSSALRIYTTTDVTKRRIYTLMHDPQYRMHITSQQTSYNQPPHPGFFLGDGMDDPPVPDIHVK
jgi:rhamnogalacturonan endolyase